MLETLLLPHCRDVKLSKKERAELDYKKEVLRLAKEKRAHLEAIEDKDVYRMPDSYEAAGAKRHDQLKDLLTARYQCAPQPLCSSGSPSCRRDAEGRLQSDHADIRGPQQEACRAGTCAMVPRPLTCAARKCECPTAGCRTSVQHATQGLSATVLEGA